jgi:hypothetical protein
LGELGADDVGSVLDGDQELLLLFFAIDGVSLKALDDSLLKDLELLSLGLELGLSLCGSVGKVLLDLGDLRRCCGSMYILRHKSQLVVARIDGVLESVFQ